MAKKKKNKKVVAVKKRAAEKVVPKFFDPEELNARPDKNAPELKQVIEKLKERDLTAHKAHLDKTKSDIEKANVMLKKRFSAK